MASSTIRQVPPARLHEHPQAGLVPPMRRAEWDEFYADVALRGITTPLEVQGDGTVLDGRHRLKAALELGLPAVPVIDARLGAESADVYMLKAAVLRRHLTDSQRAAMSVLWAQEHKAPTGAAAHGKSARRRADLPDTEHPARAEATATFKVSRRQHNTAAQVFKHDPELFGRVHAGEIDLRDARRTVAKEKRAETREQAPTLPAGLYDLIYADPPWRYEFAETESRAIENQYPTLSLAEICALDVRRFLPEDAVLLLWATPPKLEEALQVVNAWGFTYRSCLVWVKNAIGMGYWARQRHELLLVARRGNFPAPPPELRPDSVIEAARGRHSAKPDEAYALIERMFPGARRLELFARQSRDGWAAWGNEAL